MSPSTPSEVPALVKRAQGGDRDAFGELVKLFNKQVKGYVRCKVEETADLDDVVSDSWMRALENIDRYDETRSAFPTWVKKTQARSAISAHFQQHDVQGLNADAIGTRAVDIWAIRRFEEILCKVFGGTAAPHQQIVFGYRVLLDWKPAEIATMLSEHPLAELAERLERDLDAVIAKPFVRRCLRPLLDKLRLPVGAVVQGRTIGAYKNLLAHEVGSTRLEAYFTGNPAQNISRWWKGVLERLGEL